MNPAARLVAVTLACSLVVASGLLAVGYVLAHDSNQTRGLAQQIQRESRARVNQSCVLSDRRYRQRVASLALTYQYLLDLKPDERNTTLNKLLRNQLSTAERDTAAEHPPAFCDVKGVGLPGRNPPLPKRPEALR